MSNLEAPPAAPPAAPTQQQPSADQLLEMIRQTKSQLKLEKPEKFSGAVRSTTEAFNWVTKTHRYLTLSETKPELRVIYASQFLTGTAQTWYNSVAGPEYQTPADNWDAFAAAFLLRFQEVNNKDKMLQQFFHVTQADMPKRTLTEYIETFTRLWTVVRTELSETVAVQRFVEGLQPRTKVDVKRAKLVTLHEAIYEADSAESMYLGSFQKRQQGRSSQPHNQARTTVSNSVQASGSGVQGRTDGTGNFYGPGPMELSSLISALQGVQRQQGGDKKAHARQNGLCFKCNKPGHVQRNCPTKGDMGKGRA